MNGHQTASLPFWSWVVHSSLHELWKHLENVYIYIYIFLGKFYHHCALALLIFPHITPAWLISRETLLSIESTLQLTLPQSNIIMQGEFCDTSADYHVNPRFLRPWGTSFRRSLSQVLTQRVKLNPYCGRIHHFPDLGLKQPLNDKCLILMTLLKPVGHFKVKVHLVFPDITVISYIESMTSELSFRSQQHSALQQLYR